MAKLKGGATKACEICGETIYYTASGAARKYCSLKCAGEARKQGRPTACQRCGKPFERAPSVGGKFCSRTCYAADRLKRETCAVCQSPLSPDQMLYCSPSCRAAGRTSHEQKPCEACGKAMMVYPHQIDTKRACSRACAAQLKRGKREGPGGRFKRPDGYIWVYYPSHPDATPKRGLILEHRLVMEQKLGRRLLRTETVNHINHIRDDNRPENLEILTRRDHAKESNAFGRAKRKEMMARLAAYEAKYGPLE